MAVALVLMAAVLVALVVVRTIGALRARVLRGLPYAMVDGSPRAGVGSVVVHAATVTVVGRRARIRRGRCRVFVIRLILVRVFGVLGVLWIVRVLRDRVTRVLGIVRVFRDRVARVLGIVRVLRDRVIRVLGIVREGVTRGRFRVLRVRVRRDGIGWVIGGDERARGCRVLALGEGYPAE
jgi:hypothetical protein